MICDWCDEEIEAGQRADVRGVDWHVECAIRQVTGSEAHVRQACACYVPGSTEGDDPKLTKREAAIVAARAFEAVINLGYKYIGMQDVRPRTYDN